MPSRRRAATLVVASAAPLATIVTTSLPAAAYESVNLDTTWGWGRGTIWRDSDDAIGYNLYLTDQKPDGDCVYWQVQGYRNNLPDSEWIRMTTDTCGSGETRHYTGTKHIPLWAGGSLGYDGYRVKICKNINNSPDSCSEASRITTRSRSSAG